MMFFVPERNYFILTPRHPIGLQSHRW